MSTTSEQRAQAYKDALDTERAAHAATKVERDRWKSAYDIAHDQATQNGQALQALREGVIAVCADWETATGNDLFYRLCNLIQPEPDPLVEALKDIFASPRRADQ